ncbi:hypothetical protein MMPV_002292 [Pyropia vietnamensis]
MGRFRMPAAMAGLMGIVAAIASAGAPAAAQQTIADLAIANANLTLLVRALNDTGLVPVVADPGASLTVFAPTNAAFVTTAQALGYTGTNETEAYGAIGDALAGLAPDGNPLPLLSSVLQYHVAPGEVRSGDLVAARGYDSLLNGSRVELDNDNATLIDAALTVDNPMLDMVDINASNGVIHTITGVLLPISVAANATMTPMPSPPTTAPEDEGVCFPADATVQTADGRTLRMEDVKTGDVLRTSPSTTGRIYFWSHADATGMYPFTRLTTSSGATITLSAGHYLPVVVRGSTTPVLAAAASVVVGDELTLAAGARSAVVATTTVTRRGLYAPHLTGAAGVVVDGVWASEMTTAVAPAVARPALVAIQAVAAVAGRLGLADVLRLPSGGGAWTSLAPRGEALVEL